MIWKPISTFVLIILIACAALPKPLYEPADGGTEDEITDVLKTQAGLAPSQLHPGEQAELQIKLALMPGYHAYTERFKLVAIEPAGLKIGKLRISPMVKFFDQVTKTMKDGIENQAVIDATVEISESTQSGKIQGDFALTYQACTEKFCLLPKTVPVHADFEVVGGPGGTIKQPPAQSAQLIDLAHTNILLILLSVFLAGMLTSLTPCIYPMIPITLAIIGSRGKGATKWHGFSTSLVYVLGIAVTYAVLGVIAARTGSLFGSLMNSPWVAWLIAILFVIMAFSMYGMFEMQAPAFIRDRLGNRKLAAGYPGAFAAGLLAGIVASPCVGPVLVAILTYTAGTQSSALGFILLFTFAMGIGVLLIAVGTFSHLLQHLPRSGPWMESVKFTFGTVMVGAALYYLRPVVATWVFHALVAAALILIASFFGAFQVGLHSPFQQLKKGLLLTAFWIGLLFAAATANHWLQIVPSGRATADSGLIWNQFSEEKLAQARKNGRAIIVDFSADWCGACHELDEKTYTDDDVKEFAEQNKFTLLKVDATQSTPEITELSRKHGVVGLPTILFYGSSGNALSDLTLTGFEEPTKFLARMREAVGR